LYVVQVGGNSVVESENASRGGGPSLSTVWRPARDASAIVVTASGSKAIAPPLLDGPDDSIDLDGKQQPPPPFCARQEDSTVIYHTRYRKTG
jgi:hypothetical protein